MTKILPLVHDAIWGVPMLGLILGTGLMIGWRTGFVQLRLLPRALGELRRQLFRGGKDAGISSFQALCTALAATVGTGNLIGVAGAICLGGPGSIFWMWICALLGMGIKFAEVSLAQRYRQTDKGEAVGGPMYMIRYGLGKRWQFLAWCYAAFGIVAALGVGNATQINALTGSINAALSHFSIAPSARRDTGIGLLMSLVVFFALTGGAGRIASIAQALVPLASAGYILMCCVVLLSRAGQIPQALGAVFRGAFSPGAATGGIIASWLVTVRTGCARGIFTNEAGMGTASIAHAAAQTDLPCRQGLMGIAEVFLDTLLMCTLTALVILVSGVPIPYGCDAGADLTLAAFQAVLGDWAVLFLAAAVGCFAFATVLGWGLYGQRCLQFLTKKRYLKAYTALQTVTVVLGAAAEAPTLWLFSETLNGLMAIPNLVALAVLCPELRRLTIEFERKTGRFQAGGGTPCRFPSTQTAANPLPCVSSTPWRWLQKKRERRSTI